jgi:hypothetical protein
MEQRRKPWRLLQRQYQGPLLALLLAACSGGNTPTRPDNGWQNFGFGQTIRLGNPFPFEPPIAYVFRESRNLGVGRTMKIDYTVTGNGTLQTPQDNPPAQIRLFLWRDGDTGGNNASFRIWCPTPGSLAPGQRVLSCAINGSWTGVFGVPVSDAGIASLINTYNAMGFTCGGRDFAGKGCRGNGVQMRINSFGVQ